MIEWIGPYKVETMDWIDGKNIYMNVQYFYPGSSVMKPPAWEKTVYIADGEKARNALKNFKETIVEYISRLKIPQGGHALISFE